MRTPEPGPRENGIRKLFLFMKTEQMEFYISELVPWLIEGA
jgi:hypothetical protein